MVPERHVALVRREVCACIILNDNAKTKLIYWKFSWSLLNNHDDDSLSLFLCVWTPNWQRESEESESEINLDENILVEHKNFRLFMVIHPTKNEQF